MVELGDHRSALLSADMNQPRRGRLRTAAGAFVSNAMNSNLRRAQLSFLGAWTAEWAFTVALGIVAYRDGGATAVGLVGLLRMVPSAVVAPLAPPLADRGRRERVLVVVSTVRGVATGAAGVVVAIDGPVSIVYVLAALSTIAATLYRPAHSAVLPSCAEPGMNAGCDGIPAELAGGGAEVEEMLDRFSPGEPTDEQKGQTLTQKFLMWHDVDSVFDLASLRLLRLSRELILIHR